MGRSTRKMRQTVKKTKGIVRIFILTLLGVIVCRLDEGTVGTSITWADNGFLLPAKAVGLQISSLNPDFIEYSHSPPPCGSRYLTKSSTQNRPTGYIPSPLAAEKHRPDTWIGFRALTTDTMNIPRYDMRDPNNDGNPADNLLSPVKKQYAGNCWAFATFASLESHLMQYYGIEEDFSVDKLITGSGFDWSGYNGGNMDMSAAYLTRHDGPSAQYDDVPLRYVDNIIFLPVRSSVYDNDYIKTAILQYGGLYTSMQWSDSSYSVADDTYYYDDPDDSLNDANHAVVIVGWDDGKKVSGAPGTGAFIVRNSWGNQWGENGYFYISYFDESIALVSLVGFDDKDESSLEFDEIHYHDALGCLSSLGYGSPVAWGANRFIPSKDGYLKAVSFYALRANMTYEIIIYDEFNKVTLGQPLLSQQGVLDHGGWHTILLNQELPIRQGDDYTVVVKFSTVDYYYPVPIELPIPNYSSSATANPGESFISSNGYNWQDVTDFFSDTNICIKALVGNQATMSSDYEVKHYFPKIASDLPWETEICLINTSAQHNLNGELKAFDGNGQQVGASQSIHLSPNARQEITVGYEFLNADMIQYIVIESDTDTLAGYARLFCQGRYRVAVPMASKNDASDIHVPHIASNARWWTELTLLNTTSESKNIVIEFNTGLTVSRVFNPNAQQSFRIKDLCNGISQPEIESARIKNAEGIIGTELYGSTDATNDNYLSGILLKSNVATDLYYPHVASNAQWWTGIIAYNPNDAPCTLSVATYDQGGTILSHTSRNLGAREKLVAMAKNLGFPEKTAWFSIHADMPIAGFEAFGTTDRQQLGGYNGVHTQRRTGIFPLIEKQGWTAIALVNIEPDTAAITFNAFDDNGGLITSESLLLDGYAKSSGHVQDIFTRDISAATYIAFTSDRNVIGFELNGSSDRMMLDGLPGM